MILFKIAKKKFGSDKIVGNTDLHYNFHSNYLKNDRNIIVWLPPSYEVSDKTYPVLYMQDGQNLFDPKTSYIGYDWRVDETLSKLIKRKKIEEIITVGICNTEDRLEEYNYFTDKGKKYSEFLIGELKPFIDKNYRTKPDKINTAVMGSSMGGLISFQLAWFLPEVFGKAACMSNSFWVSNREIFDKVKIDTRIREKQKIYIDCGLDEKDLIDDIKKMCSLLKEIGTINKNNLYCHFAKGGKHSEIDWAKRLHIPFKFLFKNEK